MNTEYTPEKNPLMTRAQIGQALECAYIESSELEDVIDNVLAMLSKVRAEAKAEALNEVADEWERLVKIGKQQFTETTREDRAAFDDWAGQEKPGWLRARANQYKENQS